MDERSAPKATAIPKISAKFAFKGSGKLLGDDPNITVEQWLTITVHISTPQAKIIEGLKYLNYNLVVSYYSCLT